MTNNQEIEMRAVKSIQPHMTTKPKNPAAVALGSMPKKYSAEELVKRTERLKVAREKRWPKNRHLISMDGKGEYLTSLVGGVWNTTPDTDKATTWTKRQADKLCRELGDGFSVEPLRDLFTS